MKTIEKALLSSCIILFALVPLTYAQESSGNDAQENIFKIGGIDVNSGIVRKFDNRYEGVKGSPFYMDEWSAGAIDLVDGTTTSNVRLKYNQYEDELIIQQSAGLAYYLPKEKIGSFTVEDERKQSKLFIKKNHHKKKDETQFYRVLSAGEVYLLEYTKVVFEKANFEGGYSNDKKFDDFKKYPSYYYLTKDADTPIKLKQSTNAVAKVFQGNEDQIKRYISENKLDCRSADDLMQVFRYHNSLN